MNTTARIALSSGILLGVITVGAISLNASGVLSNVTPLVQNSQHVDTSLANTGDSQAVFTLKVGTCFNQPADGIVTQVSTVPCSTAHDFEDFYRFPLTAPAFPGEKSETDKAASVCGGSEFQKFDGVSYDSSSLGVTFLYPTAESWATGDRTIDCVVAAQAGQSTGTYRGTSK